MDNHDDRRRKRFGVPDPEQAEDAELVRGTGPHELDPQPFRAGNEAIPAPMDSQTEKRKWGVPLVEGDSDSVRPAPSDLDARTWVPPSDAGGKVSNDEINAPDARGVNGVWRSPILLSLSVLLISVGLLFIVNQILAFIRVVEESPFPFRVMGWSAFGLLCLALLFSSARLWWSFRRLRTNPGITLACSSTLSANRKAWSAKGANAVRVSAVLAILRSYPRSSEQRRLLARGKLRHEEFEGNLDYLDRGEVLHDLDWLAECRTRYVEPLRACAEQIVHDYSVRVALKTALVRNGILDTLIVWINAVLLLEELCRVFNVRTNRVDSIVMVGRLAFTTMISAKAADFIDDASDHLTHEGQSTMAEFLASAAAKYALKGVGEGSVNYFLFRRLGRAAVAALMPIRES